jgi:hypothetical protein
MQGIELSSFLTPAGPKFRPSRGKTAMPSDLESRMLKMLDRIHERLDTKQPIDGDMFSEIGCLIAEAKGEYDPNRADDMDAEDYRYNRGPM